MTRRDGRRPGPVDPLRGHGTGEPTGILAGRGGLHADRIIIDETHDPPPPPDDCPVHDLPRDAELVVHDGVGQVTTTAGAWCDAWHDGAPLRAMFTAAMHQARRELGQAEGHTVVPPAFRRPVRTSPNTRYPRVREDR